MLSLKHIAINSFNENIAYLHKDCDTYKVDDIKDITKVEIHGGAAPIYAFLEIIDDASILAPKELGLNTEAFSRLNLPEGANVSLSMAGLPPSAGILQRKIAGNILSSGEYNAVVKDIVAGRYSNMDIASFWSLRVHL